MMGFTPTKPLMVLSSWIIFMQPAFSSSSSNTQMPFNQPDRWVSASPIAITAVCQDGFAMVATHTTSIQEPLLMPVSDSLIQDNDEELTPQNTNGKQESEIESNDNTPQNQYPSLPSSYRGPLRIERLDGAGTYLVSAGWRSDCISLAEKCHSIIASEIAQCGGISDQGRVLAESASLWMAQCAFSNNVRALSCVGLLASSTNNHSGSLWLIDSTGSYSVRALAIGNGASTINKRLCKIAFHEVSKEEGVKLLLKALEDTEGSDENFDDDGEKESVNRKWVFPEGSHIESAVLKFGSRSSKRIRDPFVS